MGGMKSAIKPPSEGGTSCTLKWKVSTSKESIPCHCEDNIPEAGHSN